MDDPDDKHSFEKSPWYFGAVHEILVAGDVNRLTTGSLTHSTKPTLTRSFDLGDMAPVHYFREHGEIGNFAAEMLDSSGEYDKFSTIQRYHIDESDDEKPLEYHRIQFLPQQFPERSSLFANKSCGEGKQVTWGSDVASEEGDDKDPKDPRYASPSPSAAKHDRKSALLDHSSDERADTKILSRPYGDYVNTIQEGRNHPRKRSTPQANVPAFRNSTKIAPSHQAFSPYHELLGGLSSAELKLNFFQKLLQKFPENRLSLEQDMGLIRGTKGRNIPKLPNIYVFVDFSNIKIGFQEALSTLCGNLPRGLMSLPQLNFENLAWILERGRMTMARHLAGSRPMREQMEAEACKYKCNLLDRVLKVPHETPRKRAFRLRSGGYTSGSDSVDPAPRYVEQGVDEVLNMLMSQTGFSVKDPGTLVLASGDGAPGEFSSGYFDLIQTFLAKNWKVEIYSFKKNLSHLYRGPAFRRRWGKQFQIFELDEYALFLVQQIED